MEWTSVLGFTNEQQMGSRNHAKWKKWWRMSVLTVIWFQSMAALRAQSLEHVSGLSPFLLCSHGMIPDSICCLGYLSLESLLGKISRYSTPKQFMVHRYVSRTKTSNTILLLCVMFTASDGFRRKHNMKKNIVEKNKNNCISGNNVCNRNIHSRKLCNKTWNLGRSWNLVPDLLK